MHPLRDQPANRIADYVRKGLFEQFMDKEDFEATMLNISRDDIENAQRNINDYVHFYSHAEAGIHDSIFGQLVHAVKVKPIYFNISVYSTLLRRPTTCKTFVSSPPWSMWMKLR